MGTVAFQRRGGLIFVPVEIHGLRGTRAAFRFVLDTGTAVTILEVGQAQRLGLGSEGAVRRSRVRSVIGEELGYVVRAPGVRSMGVLRRDFQIACHSLPLDDDLDGLLGADFFTGLRLVIDYGTGTVELTDSLA